jgi:mono/diheme cytochrome c family protein
MALAVALASAAAFDAGGAEPVQDEAVAAAPPATMTREQARALESPVAYGDDAIREGRKHYLRLCQNCHGKDGKALESFDFEATDLTQPDLYRHGSTDGDLFFSTREGAGNDMPPFKDKLTDQQVWEVVLFLRSIGPESARPQADGAADAESGTESESP